MSVLADMTCLRDGAPLEHVVTGRIIAGREGSIILRCTACGLDHHVRVTLSLVGENLDTMVSSHQPIAVCGTESGYSRHRNLGTETCEPCREAHREGNRRRALREPVSA